MNCPSCGAAIADAWAKSCPKCGYWIYMLDEDGEKSAHAVKLGGYLPDPALGGPRLRTDAVRADLPRKVDLRPGCTAIEDQGALGSCTANAAVGALEFHRKRVGLEEIDLSRLFVYYNARRLRGSIDVDSGATISESMAAVMAYGAPDARLWPYEPAKFKEQPSQEVYQSATSNEAIEFARVTPRDGVLAVLAKGFPVCFGCFLPGSAYQAAAKDGVMPAPSEQQWISEEKGGHAMLIVGYDLDREIYIVRNSWGQRYGDKGYLYIPFQVMDRGAHPESYWIIGKLEQEDGFRVERPSEAAPVAAKAEPSLDTVGDAAKALREEIRGGLKSELSDLRKGLRDRLTDKK